MPDAFVPLRIVRLKLRHFRERRDRRIVTVCDTAAVERVFPAKLRTDLHPRGERDVRPDPVSQVDSIG